MAMLKAKLFQLEEEKKAAELAAIRGEQKDIAWGSQIRNYVFHPYSMVKIYVLDMRLETLEQLWTEIWIRLWMRT